MSVDRTSGVKLKYQVADRLRERIRTGEYPPGSKLPSQRELEEEFGVSAETVRDGLSVLKIQGLVVSRQGSGHYVRTVDHKYRMVVHQPIGELRRSATLAEPPISVTFGSDTEAVRWEPADRDVPASSWATERLGPRVHDEMVRQGRTLVIDSVPVLMQVTYLPVEAAGEREPATASGVDVEAGQVELLGQVDTPDGLSVDYRPATFDEAQALGLAKSQSPSLLATTGLMLIDGDGDQVVEAAIEILARGDLVGMDIKPCLAH